jgi:predicted small lipoprotein YifL
LLLTVSLCACGQSGDLYLPDTKPAASEQTGPDDKKDEKAAVVPPTQDAR